MLVVRPDDAGVVGRIGREADKCHRLGAKACQREALGLDDIREGVVRGKFNVDVDRRGALP